MNTDITFCVRECGNMDCERNMKHLPMYNPNVSFASFDDCEEWVEVGCSTCAGGTVTFMGLKIGYQEKRHPFATILGSCPECKGEPK